MAILPDLISQRQNAGQGDFFFTKIVLSDGNEYARPVFVLGRAGNDSEDLIICSCTAQPKRTDFDIEVQLKKKTYIRTNKIYTVQRDSLLFKIDYEMAEAELAGVVQKATEAISVGAKRFSPFW